MDSTIYEIGVLQYAGFPQSVHN